MRWNAAAAPRRSSLVLITADSVGDRLTVSQEIEVSIGEP